MATKKRKTGRIGQVRKQTQKESEEITFDSTRKRIARLFIMLGLFTAVFLFVFIAISSSTINSVSMSPSTTSNEGGSGLGSLYPNLGSALFLGFLFAGIIELFYYGRKKSQ